MVLEAILLVVMIVLMGVLIFEVREYRQAAKFSESLEAVVTAYGVTFTSLVDTVKSVEEAYNQSVEVHQSMADQLTMLWNIIEIHNKAIHLDPSLTKIGRNENKIP